MKNILKNTYFLIVSTLIIGFAIGWFIKPSTQSHDQHIEASVNQTFTCSMHPHVRQNEPGACPICGMNLVPLESTIGELDPMAVSMSPTAMQLAQVQTKVVENGSADKHIRLNGKVQADERLIVTQSSHIPGRIEQLTVDFTGALVNKGQVIAYIYSPDLVTAQQELFEAFKIKESHPALYQAAREKLKYWKLTDKQIDQILDLNKAIDQFPILADVTGYVTKKMVQLGDHVKSGDHLYEIADLSKVWILFDVYEADMSWIKNGSAVSYKIKSIPGQTFEGTISYIDPVIDPKTRVAKARVESKNRDLLFKPEMFASGTVKSRLDTKSNSFTVPKTAVMWTGKRSVVYVMQSTDHGVSFLMREVTLGAELGESYVIESGLQSGEEIAVNGTFSIDAAAQLAGKPSMMNPEGSVVMTGHNHGGSMPDGQGKSSDEQSTDVQISKKQVVPEEIKEALQPLFKAYFEMKASLASDDYEQAREAGKTMNSELGKINMNVFKGEAHSIWMKQFSSLEPNVKHIEHMGEIKDIRNNFIDISNAMIAIAETFDPFPTPIYVQHCPMADSNKGADWLSTEEEILNPYFGHEMLSCGETTRTIK